MQSKVSNWGLLSWKCCLVFNAGAGLALGGTHADKLEVAAWVVKFLEAVGSHQQVSSDKVARRQLRRQVPECIWSKQSSEMLRILLFSILDLPLAQR